MRNYTQLTKEQRYQISALLKTGQSQTQIAKVIGVDKSTISRELKRNKGRRGYRPKQADAKAQACKYKSKVHISREQWEQVDQWLRLDWSPQQIHDQMQILHEWSISHEWIYQHVLQDKQMGGKLYQHLRCQKKRHKRYGKYEFRGRIPDRVGIEQRPEVVDERSRLGDWEADTVFGCRKHQAIVTVTERKSRFTLMQKVTRKTSQEVGDALIELLQPYPVLTLTVDNGKEFMEHQRVAQALQADVYFAHPNSAWERGTNENTNGLIRQYFPKGSDFSNITNQEIEFAINRLNHRPRKCLNFESPSTVMLKYLCCT
jgi:IS30 family transposase